MSMPRLISALILAAHTLAGMGAAQGQTASAAVPGVSASTIVLGQSVALSGAQAPLAGAFARGAALHFARVNAAGGVNGRRIELSVLDDAGDPAQALANTNKLLAQGVLALFGYYGSPQVTAAYAAIKDTDALLYAPMAAADELRGAQYPNVYTIRPGFAEEAAAITRHAETLGARRLAIVHAADAESLAALDSAERTMTSMGANLVAKAPLAQAERALAARPESVLVIGEPAGAAAAIKAVRAKGFRGPLYGFSNTGESLLAEQIGPAGAGVVLVRVVPKPDHQRMPVVRDLIADVQQAGAGRPNVYMLEGYIAARVFVEGLRRAGRDLTRGKLRRALDSIDDVSVGGFRVHFTDDRVGSRLVELSLIDSQGRIRE